MKKLIALISAIGLAIALVGTSSVITGCTTTGSGTNVTQTVDINKLALGLQLGVKTGTQYALTKEPKSRVYFVATVTALDTFVLTSTNTTPQALEVALQNLPVSEIKSPEAQLAISTVLDLYTFTYADAAKASIGQNTNAVVLLTAARNGVSQGLALVPAPASFKLSAQH